MRRGMRGVLGVCVAAAAALSVAPAASAATAVGDYRFNDTLAPTGGLGPALTNIGPGANGFIADPSLGSTVLSFPLHNGVQMAPVGIPAGTSYSVVTTFRLDLVSSYRRILDWKNGTSDEGLYVHNGKLSLYFGGATDSAEVLFAPNAWNTVAYSTNTPSLGSQAYFNGTKVVSSSLGPGITDDTLRFFRDGAGGTPNEDSPGAVACIRVFSGTLSDAEVAAIGTSVTCGGPVPVAKKKCKKRKKGKGKSGASAAKKKRKKCGRKKRK